MRGGHVRRSREVLGILLASTAVLAACGDDGTAATAFETVRTATLESGAALPESVDPALIVYGPNGDQLAALDVATLERFGLVRATTYERWFKRDVTFEGPWLADVLNATDPSGQGKLLLRALDDFEVTIDRADLKAGDALLAIRTDAGPIPVADGGPVRLVFLDQKAPIGADGQNWIWNLHEIHPA